MANFSRLWLAEAGCHEKNAALAVFPSGKNLARRK
jgi:hypothetical protein